MLSRIRVHFRDSAVVHVSIDGQLLDPGRNEETSGVLADDLHLQHAVHKGDPVVDPGETAASTFDVTAKDATEETAVDRRDNKKLILNE